MSWLVPMIEEDIEQYEEEDYEQARCNTLGILCRNYVYVLFTPYYYESIWNIPISVDGQVFNGKNYKKYSQYFMEYCALATEIREVLYFFIFMYSGNIEAIQRSLLWGKHEKYCTHG